MKVVVFWHAGLLTNYRKYVEEIAKQKDVEATLIVPEYWPFEPNKVRLRDYFSNKFKKRYFDGEKIKELSIIQRKGFLPGKTVHFYPGIGKVLNEIKPDVIYIYTEPFVLTVVQIIRWRNKHSKKTKIVVENCENIEKKFNHFYEDWAYKYALKNADGMIAMTSEIEKILRKKGYKGPIEIIGEGADSKKFKRIDSKSLRKELGIDKYFVIGYCGRMTEEKGLLVLVEAVSKLKEDFRLLIIGGGGEEFKQKVIDTAKKLNVLDKLVFVGQIAGSDLPKYLSCFDVGVAPSLTTPSWKEQFGRFTSEFILSGVSIIGSNSSTVDEVLKEDAIIYNERDADELAKKIEMLMKDPEIGKRQVRVGKKRVLSHHTNEKIAEKFVEFARSLDK